MLHTLPVPFDHHAYANGRTAFAAWAHTEGNMDISREPVFRYGRSYADGIEQLREMFAAQNCLFLNNIVGHSSALTCSLACNSDDTLAFTYDCLESLIRKPNIVGHLVDDSLVADALQPLVGWLVICGEGSFDDSPSEAGLTTDELIHPSPSRRDTEGVYICRLADARAYASNRIGIDFRAYFVHPAANLDLSLVADRYRHDRLNEYFLRTDVTFGTLGDCHMDDDIAVSYHSDVFRFPDTQRFFIR